MSAEEEKDSFTMFVSYWMAVKAMPEELQGDFLIQLCKYRFEGVAPHFDEPIRQASFALIKPVLDKQLKDKKRKQIAKSMDEDTDISMENPRKIHGKSTEASRNRNKDMDKGNNNNNAQGELALERPTCFTFEEFWKMYGKSKRKDYCGKLWGKIPEEERQKIKEHLPRYVDANEQKFRLDPERYLKHKAWEDEIISSNPQPQAEEKIERQNDFDSWLAQEDKRRGENG